MHFCLRFILVYKQLPTCVLYLFILWQKVKQYTLCSPITIRQNKNRKELFTLLHIFVNPTFFPIHKLFRLFCIYFNVPCKFLYMLLKHFIAEFSCFNGIVCITSFLCTKHSYCRYFCCEY